MNRLGERIRKTREKKQMQMNDLAQKVGISSSALSQIEHAKAFPSIVTLKSIADSLQTTVGELIGEKETLFKNPKLSRTERKFVKGNESGGRLYLLSHHDNQKQMETFLIILEENSTADDIMSEIPGQEFIFVNKGKIEIILNKKKYILEAGDTFYFNSNIQHNVKNLNSGVTEFVWIISSPGN